MNAVQSSDFIYIVPEDQQDNPYWPLPSDYPALTEEGRREARLAALRRQSTPNDFVAAWELFRTFYLIPTEPGFFYHNFQPSPPFHYEIIRFAAMYARNLVAAPRGFAKSVIIGTELPLMLLLTRPFIRIVLGMATDKLIEKRFDTISVQLTDNPYILADFGTLKPKRGMAIWNRHHIQLTNGSRLEGFSVVGRKRGARPDLFILDDPEYDPDTESGAMVARDKFETFLFKQVIPMLEKGSGIYWIGTVIGRRSFLGHACYGDDPRFSFWNRRVYAAITTDPETQQSMLLWEQKWDKQTLDIRRAEIGDANFQTEYLNRLGSDNERVLRLDERATVYTRQDGKPIPLSLSDTAVICYTNAAGQDCQACAGDLFKQMYRVITYDPAEGLSSHHDYSCIAVMGFDRENILWILDMWMGRAKGLEVLRQLWKLGIKWKPHVIGIESVSTQISILESAETFLKSRQDYADIENWHPRVVGIDYSKRAFGTSKSDRISTLEWRFDTGRIKYPHHLRNEWPISMLYAQTRDFTYDLGLLEHDDALDAVAMAHYVIHARGRRPAEPQRPSVPTIDQMLEDGQTAIEGLPLIHAFPVSQLPDALLDTLVERYANQTQRGAVPDYSRRLSFKPSADASRIRCKL